MNPVRFKICLLLVLLLPPAVKGQETIYQVVRGKVVDTDSKSPLTGVAVSITDTDPVISASTDADGRFKLEKVPVGRRNLKATVLGYQDVFIGNLIVTSGKEVVLNLEMQEKVYETQTVEIVAEQEKGKANNDLATLSARNFNMEETNRYAGSRGDPARMASNFAGVVSQNDARNDIIVRGNSPTGVLWRLEGVDIPSPNHFSSQGAVGGPISILNNNLLANSDFLSGAFPAEYGNKNAAVFDLKMRNGNNEKREYTGQVGINGFELGAEGPFKKDGSGSYLVNYRYSTMQVFDLLGIRFGVSGVPNYQDLSYKINMPTQKAGIFSVWGVGGKSAIKLLDSEKKSSDWNFSGNGTDLVFGSMMGATGISHVYFFNEKTSGKMVLAASGNAFAATLDTLSASKEAFRTYENNTADKQLHAHYSVQSKLNRKNTLRAGVYYQHLYADYESTFWSRKFLRTLHLFNQEGDAGLLQGYTQYQHRFNDKLVFNGGVHYQQFLLNNEQTVEPRAGLKYTLFSAHQLSIAYGMHNQLQPMAYYYYPTLDTSTFTYSLTNKKLKFTRSNHLVAAYNYSFLKNYRVRLEAYYQQLDRLPIESGRQSSFSMANAGSNIEGLDLMDSLVNKGVGYNRGIELTLEKFYSRNFYFMITASLYESHYKGSDGVWRHSAFSGGYAFNALGGIEIPVVGQKQVFAVDLKATRIGGNRYVPIDLEQSRLRNTEVLMDNLAYSQQFPDYQKIDVKVSYKINQKKVTQSLFLSIENIFRVKNILRQIYDPGSGQIVREYQFGFFPYGGYRIEF